jgi:hypothetical protein
MVRIKTIDFPDDGGDGRIGTMDSNLYTLEKLVLGRLADARAEARRLDQLALARPPRTPVRQRLGAALIVLAEWLRGGALVGPARSVVR